MKITSWNVNGIRAVSKKEDFLNLLGGEEAPDILCLQETKAEPSQLDDTLLNIGEYKSYFMSSSVKKGYSGVAIYSKVEPISIKDMGVEEFDGEGRYIAAEFEEFTLINCYFPNSQEKGKRLDYKLAFTKSLLEICNKLVEDGKNIILCGDYNIAHNEIDLKNPKTNTKNPGFLPEEREWMGEFLENGYVDVFREFYPDTQSFTWWSYRFNCRAKDIGWRIDYHCVNKDFISKVKDISIDDHIFGSDHCPISIYL